MLFSGYYIEQGQVGADEAVPCSTPSLIFLDKGHLDLIISFGKRCMDSNFSSIIGTIRTYSYLSSKAFNNLQQYHTIAYLPFFDPPLLYPSKLTFTAQAVASQARLGFLF